MRDHRLGGFNNRNVFPHCSGSRKSEIEASLLGSQRAVLSLCLHMVFPLCVCVQLCFLKGHLCYWIRAHPNDLSLT